MRIGVDVDGATLVDVLGRARTTVKLSNGQWLHKESLEDFYRQDEGVRYVFLTVRTARLVIVLLLIYLSITW